MSLNGNIIDKSPPASSVHHPTSSVQHPNSVNINAITLEYLMNPRQYEQYIKGKESSDTSSEEDVLFYKKRIMALTKSMFNTKLPNNTDVNMAFDSYIESCVHYLKFQDRFDILQLEYVDICNNKCAPIIEYDYEKATKLIFNVPNKRNTLDKFVSIKRENPVDSLKNVMPKQKNIDLTDPKLKTKGLKKKNKKNDK